MIALACLRQPFRASHFFWRHADILHCPQTICEILLDIAPPMAYKKVDEQRNKDP